MSIPQNFCFWPLSTFVATQHFGSYRSNSGRAAHIEPTLMTDAVEKGLVIFGEQ
jgi:hypothetical protein